MTDASDPASGHRRTPAPASPPAGTVHLVLGYDADPVSQRALAVAIDLAARLRAQLHVVHAVALADYPIDPDRADWDERGRLALAAERTVIESALRFHTTGWSYHEGRGDPARLLCELADAHDALMVIVGSHHGGRLTGLQRLGTGSVSHQLIAQAHCPVLVVPDHGPPP
ncbi:MAG: universal stress protein [Lapillicoccus sp.]